MRTKHAVPHAPSCAPVQYARFGGAGPAPPQPHQPLTHAAAIERLAGPQAGSSQTIPAMPSQLPNVDALTDTFEQAFRDASTLRTGGVPQLPPGQRVHMPPGLQPHAPAFGPQVAGPAGAQLHASLHTFMHTAPHARPMPPTAAGSAGAVGANLSLHDKVRIRDRSAILARHLFADRGDAFADSQAHTLLANLGISAAELPQRSGGPVDADAWSQVWQQQVARGEPPAMAQLAAQPPHARLGAQGNAWADAFAAAQPQQARAAQWAAQFADAPQAAAGPALQGHSWANEFHSAAEPPSTGAAWAEEFEQSGMATGVQAAESDVDAAQQSRRLADVLQRDPEGKFNNSQFLQFLSKMSQGQTDFSTSSTAEGASDGTNAGWVDEFVNAAPPAAAAAPDAWAGEFASRQQQSNATQAAASWAEDFVGTAEASGAVRDNAAIEAWAQDFAREQVLQPSSSMCVILSSFANSLNTHCAANP